MVKRTNAQLSEGDECGKQRKAGSREEDCRWPAGPLRTCALLQKDKCHIQAEGEKDKGLEGKPRGVRSQGGPRGRRRRGEAGLRELRPAGAEPEERPGAGPRDPRGRGSLWADVTALLSVEGHSPCCWRSGLSCLREAFGSWK